MWQFIARTGRNVGRPGEAVTSEAGVLLEGVAAGLAARSDSVRLRLGHQVEGGDGTREHVRLEQQDRAPRQGNSYYCTSVKLTKK